MSKNCSDPLTQSDAELSTRNLLTIDKRVYLFLVDRKELTVAMCVGNEENGEMRARDDVIVGDFSESKFETRPIDEMMKTGCLR
jgi:hypothetical protein